MAISEVAGFATSASAVAQSTLSVTPVAAGDLMVVSGRISSGAIDVTGVSGGGVNAWQKLTSFSDATDSRTVYLWMGPVATTGAQTITLSFSGSVAATSVEIVADSFTAGLGRSTTWGVDGAPGTVQHGASDSGTIINYPTLTPTVAGEAYWGYMRGSTTVSTNTTPGYTYYVTTASDLVAFNPSVGAGVAQTPSAAITAASNYDSVAVVFSATPSTFQQQPPVLGMIMRRAT